MIARLTNRFGSPDPQMVPLYLNGTKIYQPDDETDEIFQREKNNMTMKRDSFHRKIRNMLNNNTIYPVHLVSDEEDSSSEDSETSDSTTEETDSEEDEEPKPKNVLGWKVGIIRIFIPIQSMMEPHQAEIWEHRRQKYKKE